ncbi:MAG: hypothetical protein ACPIOQ_18015, partial [Promethearchaeia archaeon]
MPSDAQAARGSQTRLISSEQVPVCVSAQPGHASGAARPWRADPLIHTSPRKQRAQWCASELCRLGNLGT